VIFDAALMMAPIITFVLLAPILDALRARRTGELPGRWRGWWAIARRDEDPVRFDRAIRFLLFVPAAFLAVLATTMLWLSR